MNLRTSLIICAAFIVGACGALAEQSHHHSGDDREWSVQKKQEITRSFGFTSSTRSRVLLIDNLRGAINVKKYGGDSVLILVHETFHASSDEELAEAQKKISIEFDNSDNRVFACVKTPWRCNSSSSSEDDFDDDCCCNHEDDYNYDADCDFEIDVPAAIELKLRTVEAGGIDVDGVDGTMDIRNVNGGIFMTNISGSGRMTTVNGDVRVSFVKNPALDCRFATINGRVEVEFPDDLAANVSLKTMNGQVYTSYDVKDLPRRTLAARMKGSKRVYRGDDSYAVQIGSGGPALSFNTLNGNIYILKHGDSERGLN